MEHVKPLATVLVLLAVIVVAYMFAESAGGFSRVLPGTDTAGTTVTCAADEYSCPCATGSYCLRRGAMCLTPNSACPVK